MTVLHARVTAAEDYLTRREPHRTAHLERLQDLRARGPIRAIHATLGGRAPAASA